MASSNVLESMLRTSQRQHRYDGYTPGLARERQQTSLGLLPTIAKGALLIVAFAGCGDPVRERAIEALGPETAGVPPGPLHRPGQPCVVCHGDTSEAPAFSFAGTVYVDAPTLVPIDDVVVTLFDLLGGKFSTTTNCAGSFFVRPDEYALDGPIWVSLQRDDVFRDMATPIYRDGSCTGCHADPQGPTSAGHVYLIDDPLVEKAPVSRCP